MAKADDKDTLLDDYQQKGTGDEQGNESLGSSNKEEADAKAKEEADAKAKEEADAKAKEEADAKAKAKKTEAAKNDFGKIVEILPSKLVITDKGLKFPNTDGFKVGDTLIKENNKVVVRKGKG